MNVSSYLPALESDDDDDDDEEEEVAADDEEVAELDGVDEVVDGAGEVALGDDELVGDNLLLLLMLPWPRISMRTCC